MTLILDQLRWTLPECSCCGEALPDSAVMAVCSPCAEAFGVDGGRIYCHLHYGNNVDPVPEVWHKRQ